MSRSHSAHLLYGFELPHKLDTRDVHYDLQDQNYDDYVHACGYCGYGDERHFIAVPIGHAREENQHSHTLGATIPAPTDHQLEQLKAIRDFLGLRDAVFEYHLVFLSV